MTITSFITLYWREILIVALTLFVIFLFVIALKKRTKPNSKYSSEISEIRKLIRTHYKNNKFLFQKIDKLLLEVETKE